MGCREFPGPYEWSSFIDPAILPRWFRNPSKRDSYRPLLVVWLGMIPLFTTPIPMAFIGNGVLASGQSPATATKVYLGARPGGPTDRG